MDHKFSSVDTIYRIKKKIANTFFNSERPYYYFYKSIQVIISFWIVTVLAITATPWLDYWVKTKINQTNKVTLGQSTSEPAVEETPLPLENPMIEDNLVGHFYLKNNTIELEAPIVEGIDENSLKQGIGHHPDSAWPNQKGNMVLAGHNTDLDAENPYARVFFHLREVNLDDEVMVTYQGKNYYYKVFKRETVKPDDTSLFGPTDDWILTFYTCDPPYTDWKRLVFQAKLEKIE